jgi:NADPH-dependent glutamate synthase beta subunit-like oxidoreductase
MIRLKIDNTDIEVSEGTTLLEAAQQAGITIPSMCYLKGYGNRPSCMVCLVKDKKSGAFIPSCAMLAANGMDISSTDTDVLDARRISLELLLSDHVGDCEAPCSLACPAGMNIPLMNRLIGDGSFTEALAIVKEEIALPHILGYICPAPCEKACRRKQVDSPVSICLLKRVTAALGTDEKCKSVAITDNEQSTGKVAIIGSGPAGLAAAYYLQIYGHTCTIFDKSSEAGGTLRFAISEADLPKSIIDQEADIIKSMGAEFRFNSLVDEDFFNSEIKGQFDAIIIATGDISSGNSLTNIADISATGYRVNDKNMSTSVPGIFVCGSAIRAHKMAVRSVAQGKTAADSVHNYLKNKSFEKPAKMFNSRFDKLQPVEYAEYLKESTSTPVVIPSAGVTGGFSSEEAMAEARRCLHCDCRKQDNCKLRIYANEYNIDRKKYLVGERKMMTKQIQHELIVYEPEKCIRCGLCIEISSAEGEKFGLSFEGRGFDVVINTPLGVTLSEGLSKAAGKCAAGCPTGALSLRSENSYNCKLDLKDRVTND